MFDVSDRYCKCDRCDSGEGTGAELHPCPYGQDLDGDDRDVCNCCPSCMDICCDDI